MRENRDPTRELISKGHHRRVLLVPAQREAKAQ
jgi:hypothetical protein